jgi:hypothetical protein
MSSNAPQQGPAQGGESFSRQSEEPRKPVIELECRGGVFTSPPAHMLGLKGAPLYYGKNFVGGFTNLFCDGAQSFALQQDVLIATGAQLAWRLAAGTGGEFDNVVNAAYGHNFSFTAPGGSSVGPALNIAGEWNVPAQLVLFESFTTAGTVDQVTNGSPNIVGAGTNWVAATLPGYAYTPSLNKIRQGDIIFITQAASTKYYRIVSITDATHMAIYPNFQGTTAGPGAGLAYGILRVGYGSHSRAIPVVNSATGAVYTYYCGNQLDRGTTNAGTIECVFGVGGLSHFMAPQSGSADLRANDIAYYKSFLISGAGTAISWSVAGFPTSFSTGFGSTDMPASNIAVLDPSDEFVTLEFMGDQLLAVFEQGAWLVRPTGSVPEFDFQRLAIDPFTILNRKSRASSPVVISQYSRPTTTGRKGVYIDTTRGLCRISPQQGVQVLETPVMGYQGKRWPASATSIASRNLSFEENTGSVLLHAVNATSPNDVMAYNEELEQWSRIQLDDTGRTSMSCVAATKPLFIHDMIFQTMDEHTLSYACLNGSTNETRRFCVSIRAQEGDPTTAILHTWTWASPIVFVSDFYPDYNVGGVLFRMRSGLTQSSQSINFTLYGGSNPYDMKVRYGPVPLPMDLGSANTRVLLGPTIDDAYIAVLLTSTSWFAIKGVTVLPSDTAARR